jgi:type I restriction enzyme S subunit
MTKYKMMPLDKVLSLDRDEVVLQPTTVYRIAGIYSFGKGLFERDSILGSSTKYSVLFRLHEGQFVISRLNGWEGAIGIVDATFDGCFVSNEYPTFTVNIDIVDPAYLRWVVRWPKFWEHLVPRGSMVRRKRVKPEQLLGIKIPLPCIDEQRLILRRLSLVNEYAEGIQSRSADSVTRIMALQTANCIRPDLSDRAKIEQGWQETTLSEVMQPATDRVAVEPDGSYPNLGIYSFGRGVFVKPDIEGGATSARVLNRVRAGQFIYSRLFAFEGAYAVVPAECDGYCVSNEFPTFDTDPEQMDARWLSSYLRSPRRWEELASTSKGLGVRRQRVPVEAVLAYKVWLPPLEQQRSMIHTNEVLTEVAAARSQSDEYVKSLVASSLNEAFGDLA